MIHFDFIRNTTRPIDNEPYECDWLQTKRGETINALTPKRNLIFIFLRLVDSF